jgi:signal transduction histidine kinase/ActR/RegA family two-component response regulator
MRSQHDHHSFLEGGGASGKLARSLDWTRTPLGAPDGWPQSLKTIVGVVLQSRHPMFLWWGPELIQIYNDAYIPSFGADKHPAAMGQRGRDCWQEIWPIIWPQIDDVMSRQRASWNEDQLVPVFRNGHIEEVYWTYGYSPVLDDEGRVGGVLVVCTETTTQVIVGRRIRTMRSLAERTALTTDPTVMLDAAVDALRGARHDVPFALIYRCDGRSRVLRLVRAVGLADPTTVDATVRTRLGPLVFGAGGPRAEVLPCDGACPLPGGVWPEPAPGLFVVAVSPSGRQSSTDVIAFGLSPRLPFDDGYRNHLTQIANHLGFARARINAFRIQAAADSERNNLLLQAPVGTALLSGPEHVFRLANPLFCRMVRRDDLVGKPYREVFRRPEERRLCDILDRVYETGEPFSTEEYLVPDDLQADGTRVNRYFRFNVEPLRDAEDQVYGMMAVATEISEQVRARQVLERSQAENQKLLQDLEAASRAKDEFLAMLGHELRNPLSPIATALQLMKLRSDSRTTREQQVIERQVNHLTRLVDDLLDVSKITRGKVELRKERVEVADVIGKAVEMAGDLFEQRSHDLVLDVAKERLCVDGDPVRLAQVVANLLTNAARYTERGGRIMVSARREGDGAGPQRANDDRGSTAIVIRVKDNGAGISPDLLPRIFDLFIQGHRSSDRAQGGLGLGLALVKNLVALHGGSVVALSDGPGKGSEFVIRLPPADEAGDSGAVRSENNRAPRHQADHGKRILVVDDNSDAADSLADLLRDAGHEVAVAYSPVAALEAVEAFRPAVAVLDIGLPVMDGYELASRLRAKPVTTGCLLIALTGYGQSHDRIRSEEGGFQYHLVKPVDIDQLMKIVDGDGAATPSPSLGAH